MLKTVFAAQYFVENMIFFSRFLIIYYYLMIILLLLLLDKIIMVFTVTFDQFNVSFLNKIIHFPNVWMVVYHSFNKNTNFTILQFLLFFYQISLSVEYKRLNKIFILTTLKTLTITNIWPAVYTSNFPFT